MRQACNQLIYVVLVFIIIMTTASSHLSKDLKQLIKTIGQTKSKQEEDRIILQQLSALKPKLAEKQLTAKQIKQHLIRALYIEMLGHSAPFAHIHAINLTQNKNLILKRIGYLMCSLFFDNNSDLLIMLVATIIKDLTNGDVHEIVICLTSLGNIMNSTIASAVSEHVLKLLSHATDLVRKKAILVLQKIKMATGNDIPEFKDKLKKALCDRQPSVMAASLNLYLQEIKENPKKYRELAGSFVIILKQVVQHKLPKQFDYHRLPAPWLQIKLLKILQQLGKGDQKSSQHCYTVLEQVLRRSEETNNNIAIAVTYQCVKTIASIYPNENLLKQAASVLAKLLQSKSANNMKYLGIQALSMLYKSNPKLLDDYQLIVVECLQSKDETLKKQTLDLLFKMTTQQNVEIIVSKMLNTLHGSTDNHFRNDLVLKITQLAQRFSTTHNWYISTMQILFELGSEYLSEDILNNFLRLVYQNYNSHQNFGEEIIIKMIELIDKIVPTDFVIKAVSWVIGQIGSSYYAQNSEKLGQLFENVKKWLQFDFQKQSTKKWIIDAMMKLASAKEFKNHPQVKAQLERFSKHGDLELYQRAIQSKRLARYNVALKNAVEMQVNFQDGLPFLAKYVENAKALGAKEYRKMRINENLEQEVNFTPYPTKQITSSFINFLNEKEKEEKKEERPLNTPSFEQKQIKPPVVVHADSPVKQKKKFVAPEDKAKQNMAKSLFGGLKTQPAKPVFTAPPKAAEAPLPKKKVQKVQNVDLI